MKEKEEMRSMKRRFLSTLMALVLALSLIPTAALAAEREASAPTASDTNFFANGTPITITDSAPDGTLETFEGFTANGDSAYISWNEDGTTKYVGVAQSVSIYGGGDGRTMPVTFSSTSITMTGGKVRDVYGGNRGALDNVEKNCSKITGDVKLSFSGEAIVWNLLHGGGANNTCVEGTVYMDFQNATAMNDEADGVWPYINGGVYGNGSEGTRNIEDGTMETNAVVNRVEITAQNSHLYLVGAGGSGSTKVLSGSVVLDNCELTSLFLGGINGEVVESSIVATGCKIGEIAATNRGFVGEGYVALNGCKIDELNTGAATGCFTSDSGGTDGSGVTGSCVWDLDESTTVTDAQLTPLVIKSSGSYTNTYENLTVQKAGDPLELEITSFVVDAKNESETQNAFTVPVGSTLTLNNVQTTVTNRQTLTNAGTINMDTDSTLTVNSGATLGNAGTINGTVDNTGGGTITEYAARVGSTGYDTLQEAINNASSGATVTLLKNVQENVTIASDDNIILELNGYTLDGGTTSGQAALTNHGTVVIQDSSEAGTGTIKRSDNGPTGCYYTVDNYAGTMTIKSGNIKNNAGSETTWSGSSLICNGAHAQATLNIEGGTISQDNFIAVKNDEQGTLNITGGTINSKTQAVQNWCEAKISGGELTGTVSTWAYSDKAGETIISGEAYIDGDVGAYWYNGGSNAVTGGTTPKVTINGGTITGTLLKATTTNGTSNTVVDAENDGGKISVTNGAFGNPVNELYLDNTLNAQLKRASNTEAPYSYYTTVTAALAAAQPGDTVTQLRTADAEIYTVTLKYNDGRADETVKATADTEITLPRPSRSGYDFRYWSNGSSTYNGGASYTVTGNVTLTAQWSAKSQGGSSSSGSSSTTYSPTLDVSDGGTIKVSPRTPEAGDKVTITPDPDSGYEVGEVTVTDRSGDAVRVTANRDGTYTFTQPRGRVTIEVTFVRAGESVFFDDVPASFWAYDEIAWAYDNGYVNGTSATTFSPNSSITRQQVWMILARLSGTDPASMAAAREWAMVNGISDGTNPGNAVTRQQLVALLYRYAQMMGYDNGAREALTDFPDAGTVSGYAQEPMQWSVANGIVAGTSAGTLNPTGTATRAQFAVILYRFWDQVG